MALHLGGTFQTDYRYYLEEEGKIIIYGAIDDTDSNDNGILDSEEDLGNAGDYDQDGIRIMRTRIRPASSMPKAQIT